MWNTNFTLWLKVLYTPALRLSHSTARLNVSRFIIQFALALINSFFSAFLSIIFWNRVFESWDACVSILCVCVAVIYTSCIILKIVFLFCRHSLLGRHYFLLLSLCIVNEHKSKWKCMYTSSDDRL